MEEHLTACLAGVVPLPARVLPLLDALGLVLAADVTAAVDLPGFDNSAMDGFAVRAADVAAATDGAPVALDVVADVPAGATDVAPLPPGTAARIMTGAPMPAGADAVVPVEWTGATFGAGAGAGADPVHRDDGLRRVRVARPTSLGRYVRLRGEDVRAGDVLAVAGTRMTARHVALLAAAGHASAAVHARPRVVVLSTGSELVPPGEPLPPGRIHDSNGAALTAAARELGAQASYAGVAADEAGAVLAAVRAALDATDLVVTTGGVSAGAYDTVKEVLAGLGTVRFDRVAMQPGMPQGFGRLTSTSGVQVPVFTLPGNPVSAMVSFEVFVRPVLLALGGAREARPASVRATAGAAWSSPAGRRQFVRARLDAAPGGGPPAVTPVVTPLGGQASHLLADLARATCLAVVPEDVERVEVGDPVDCLPFPAPLDRGPW